MGHWAMLLRLSGPLSSASSNYSLHSKYWVWDSTGSTRFACPWLSGKWEREYLPSNSLKWDKDLFGELKRKELSTASILGMILAANYYEQLKTQRCKKPETGSQSGLNVITDQAFFLYTCILHLLFFVCLFVSLVLLSHDPKMATTAPISHLHSSCKEEKGVPPLSALHEGQRKLSGFWSIVRGPNFGYVTTLGF